jgi:hypothetical protein
MVDAVKIIKWSTNSLQRIMERDELDGDPNFIAIIGLGGKSTSY